MQNLRKLPFECQKIAKNLLTGNFLEKKDNFCQFKKKRSRFWHFFDIQMAFFGRVISHPTSKNYWKFCSVWPYSHPRACSVQAPHLPRPAWPWRDPPSTSRWSWRWWRRKWRRRARWRPPACSADLSLAQLSDQTAESRGDLSSSRLTTTICGRRGHRGSDWPQMEKIRDFFRSDFSTIWLTEPKCTEIWSENVPDLSHLEQIWPTL